MQRRSLDNETRGKGDKITRRQLDLKEIIEEGHKKKRRQGELDKVNCADSAEADFAEAESAKRVK